MELWSVLNNWPGLVATMTSTLNNTSSKTPWLLSFLNSGLHHWIYWPSTDVRPGNNAWAPETADTSNSNFPDTGSHWSQQGMKSWVYWPGVHGTSQWQEYLPMHQQQTSKLSFPGDFPELTTPEPVRNLVTWHSLNRIVPAMPIKQQQRPNSSLSRHHWNQQEMKPSLLNQNWVY